MDTFLNPERIIAALGIEKMSQIADFGAGHGYFTIPLARAVGPEGRVYAIDIQKAGLHIIQAKAKLEHLLQIEAVWADLDQPGGSALKDERVDAVLAANILFQAERKETLLNEAYRVLKPKGRFALIEWNKEATLFGPDPAARIDKETAKSLALEAGFALQQEFPTDQHHYGMLFIKPASSGNVVPDKTLSQKT